MDDARGHRFALVDELKKNNWLTDPRVEDAFRAVPRHLFLPDVPLEQVYADKAISTKRRDGLAISSSSQPAIMAVMLEQLALGEGEHVLEIGAGTGYNAALLAYLVGETGHVTTIDVDEDIVLHARENLARANVANVEVICADGGFGHAANSPYGAVIATVGIWDIPPHWLEQLREGGHLVAPLWYYALQFSIAFEKANDLLVSRRIERCGFMRLRGAFAGSETFQKIDGLVIGLENSAQVSAPTLQALFSFTPRESELSELQSERNRGLLEYLALRGESVVSVSDFEKRTLGCELAFGLIRGDRSLALLLTQPDQGFQFAPRIRVYGDDSTLVRLRELAVEWISRGRPSMENAKIVAAPIRSTSNHESEFVIRKKWMEYRIDF